MPPDSINYAKGETPMTDYQFKKYEVLRAENEELRRKCDTLTNELASLRNGTMPVVQQGMTDFQFKSFVKILYQSLKATLENGATPEEALAYIAEIAGL